MLSGGLLRQHGRSGQRSPHEPLLVLLGWDCLAATGTSELPRSGAEPALAGLIAGFGAPSRAGQAQGGAYPFTGLRADGMWVLDQDVPIEIGSYHSDCLAGTDRCLFGWRLNLAA